MTRQRLHLTGLRALEAAARHLSFSKAAEELGVTPAAISNQIKALETQYSVQLFHRMTRAVELTEAGQAVWPLLRQGFDKLSSAANRLQTLTGRGSLTVSVLPFFAAKWLVPRLDRFYQAYPDIDVRIDATMRMVDLTRDNVDICVRLGQGAYPGLHVVKLMDEQAFPVCSPGLLEEGAPLATPSDLSQHTLLHVESEDFSFPGWDTWLNAAGVKGGDATRGPRFNQLGLQVQASIEGLGVALASKVLVRDDLFAGRLLRPFDLEIETNLAYYVLCRNEAAPLPLVVAFCDWIVAEAASGRPA